MINVVKVKSMKRLIEIEGTSSHCDPVISLPMEESSISIKASITLLLSPSILFLLLFLLLLIITANFLNPSQFLQVVKLIVFLWPQSIHNFQILLMPSQFTDSSL